MTQSPPPKNQGWASLFAQGNFYTLLSSLSQKPLGEAFMGMLFPGMDQGGTNPLAITEKDNFEVALGKLVATYNTDQNAIIEFAPNDSDIGEFVQYEDREAIVTANTTEPYIAIMPSYSNKNGADVLLQKFLQELEEKGFKAEQPVVIGSNMGNSLVVLISQKDMDALIEWGKNHIVSPRAEKIGFAKSHDDGPALP